MFPYFVPHMKIHFPFQLHKLYVKKFHYTFFICEGIRECLKDMNEFLSIKDTEPFLNDQEKH